MRLVFACLFSLVLVSVASEDSLLLQQAVQNLKATFGCSDVVNGVSYDISSLKSTTDLQAQDVNYASNKYMYYLNPCGIANNNPAGKCTDGKATYCQVGATSSANLGTCTMPDTGPQPASPLWQLIDPNRPQLGVKVTYANGDGCNAGGGAPPKKTGVINFYCDPNSGRGYANGTVAENPSCIFTMNIVTSAVCHGGGGSGPPAKGLSGGSVFLIILIVVLFLYIVAGCIYQRKKKGASGVESCPNIEFWRGLPVLVKEGFSFTWTKLRGLCGKGEYTEVK